MGCGNCGTGANGKPAGCKSNGGCSSGGCNRMNVYDWLNDLPLPDMQEYFPLMEVSFHQGSTKDFFRNGGLRDLYKGQWIVVEGNPGTDMGQVSLQGELVKLQLKKYRVQEETVSRKVLRAATAEDMAMLEESRKREPELLIMSRAIARTMGLDMKISTVELQADGRKATFFYTAEHRVDFRELIRAYASEFKLKIEMKQIGARQESGKLGGIGSCGRELCCSTWLTDFKTVNTAAARYQDLAINQAKLSGQCGRLKCCLNYELDTYMDALKAFPKDAEKLQVAAGTAFLQKRDIFRNLMWYSFRGSSKQYPLAIARAEEISRLNKEGVVPEDLAPVEMDVVKPPKENAVVEAGFVNDVGQVSLKSLERNSRKRKEAAKKDRQKNSQPAAPKNDRQQQPSGKAPKTARPGGGEGGGGGKRERNPQQQPQRPQAQQQPPQQGQKQKGERPQNNPNKGNNPQKRRRPQGGGDGNKPKEGGE